MGIRIFAGMPPKKINDWIVEHYVPPTPQSRTTFVVETTAQYNKSGIYSAERDDASKPVVIDWGDGTVEQVDGNVNKKVHTYASIGEFTVNVSNIKTFAASASSSTWYNTTSQNKYTLKEVALGSSITIIGNSAFTYCSGLTSVTIPDSVTSIGWGAFQSCYNLTSVTIPDSVTSIGSDAFQSCSKLTSVHITDIVKWCSISFATNAANPLYNAHNLYLNGVQVTDLTIPSNVTSIGRYAFSGYRGLTSVMIPDSVTIIGNSAFTYCSGLTSVTIPDSVTSIGWGAFQSCRGLTSVKIGSGVTSIGQGAFTYCSGLTSVTIPDSVTSIGNLAFEGCSGLTSVTIPDSVTSIGQGAFTYCINLESITLGNGLHSLLNYVFYNCPKLVEVVADGMTCEYVAANADSWDLGISPDGTTHLVVVYCSDGVVVINDADSSSGELAPTINWEEFSRMLEDMPNMVSMPKVGSSLNVKYKVDVNADFIDTEWQILGYNGSIPEYVKYKNGDERIFVRSLEEDQNSANYQLLKSTFSGSPIYSRSDDGTFTIVSGKNVAFVGSDSFTYGQTNPAWGTTATASGSYSVPMNIVVDDKTYIFAGYNVTLAPKYLLGVKSPSNNKMYYHMQFDSGRGLYSYGQNDWSTSMARSWFNDNSTAIADRCASQRWNDESWGNESSETTLQLTNGLVDRIQTGSKSFYAHVMPTVNRTWTFAYTGSNTTYQNTLNWKYRRDKSGNIIINGDVTKAKSDGMKYLDGSQCEHVSDKFWLLGVGSVNCSGSNTSSYFNGYQYETAIYSELFKNTDIWTSEYSRIRLLMKEDGTKLSVARNWRLRSANSNTNNDNNSRNVGNVNDYGDVYSNYANSTNFGALLPACTIY